MEIKGVPTETQRKVAKVKQVPPTEIRGQVCVNDVRSCVLDQKKYQFEDCGHRGRSKRVLRCLELGDHFSFS